MVLYGKENSTSDCRHWGRVSCTSQKVTHLVFYSLFPSPDLKTMVTSDVLAPLFHLQTLILLDISYNNIHGEIPEVGIANLSNLEFLRMRGNRFNGSLPPHLFSLKHLVFLDMSYNLIEGTLSNNSGNLSNLELLYLDHNLIHGGIPTQIGNLTNLNARSLHNNKISGAIPPSLSHLKSLSYLDLGRNFLAMELPTEIGNLSNIVSLVLSNNYLSGEIPTWLFDFNNLTELLNARIAPRSMLNILSLGPCNLSGQIPIWISIQTQLMFLDLSGNHFSGPIPTTISNMFHLVLLDLSSNRFSGNEFPIFNPNPSLVYIDLSSNKLSGQVPTTFPLGIKVLVLSQNEFSHVLPQNFSNFSQLEYLGFHSNNIGVGLRGLTLQKQIKAKNLKSLNLSCNKLFGKIPLNFGGLQSLESLDLSHNNLFGEIPYSLVKLFELSYLHLSNNKLEGRIPGGPQMERMNDPNSYTNNSGLCEMQIQVSCEKMPSKPKLKGGKIKKSQSWETWFSWEMAVIGYSSGFLSTILVMYVIGYFNVAPQPGRRRRRCVGRHGLFGFRHLIYAFLSL
ncbi:hypothetical protein GH714_001581 [Hevea brasiliensis]|uniref:Leucine-rich repeat-containing N-terminal plant-type domain-containing protein n=1 Tax=Hevea brasiliensis TaxID=3981 RepID=A0A6A6M7S6_HEVBR|nr:hypothetical protein GH714_001581 [Hevea brasiliensis]